MLALSEHKRAPTPEASRSAARSVECGRPKRPPGDVVISAARRDEVEADHYRQYSRHPRCVPYGFSGKEILHIDAQMKSAMRERAKSKRFQRVNIR